MTQCIRLTSTNKSNTLKKQYVPIVISDYLNNSIKDNNKGITHSLPLLINLIKLI